MKITLLIDADIIAYKCAVTNQTANEANSKAASIINRYVNLLQADHALVCLSDKTNWRKKVLPTYKSNRKDIERPILLDYVKQHLMDNFESIIYPGLEADDVMGILSTHPTKIEGKKIIVSEDKDMRSIPGWLYNPSKDVQPVYISEHEADRYHLYQTLTGDSTDGYRGCPNIGPVKATKILDTYHPNNWWNAILDAYRCQGLSEANALTQSRIARICRATDYDFISNNVLLWQPNKIKSTDKEFVTKDKSVSNLVEAALAQPIKTNALKETEERLNELDNSSISNDTFLKAETLYKNRKYIQAIQLFNQLCDLGHAGSQFYLGLMHLNAEGADEDYDEAVYWFHEAAQQNFAPAQYKLGEMYLYGKGIELNHDEAVYWFHEAAQQNFAPAQYKLGEMYLYGKGIELNHDEAVYWFNKAAELKNKDAQIILSQLNFNETLIDKNKKGAIYTSDSEEALIVKVYRENIFNNIKEDTVQIATYNVGDALPDASVIFHVDTSGYSGLAAQAVDLPYYATWDQAQLLASIYGQGWRLPTKDELILLQTKHKAVSNFFSHGFYWSSSLLGDANAWCQEFDNGFLTYANRGRAFRVRAVRSFEHESLANWTSKQEKLAVYQIGDVLVDGSVIYHIDISGQSGIAAQPVDLPNKNTWDQAQLLASSYGQGWRLPTKAELTLLCARRLNIGGFSPNYYWSSTESSIKGAWLQNFYDGNQICNFKTYSYKARAVRTFFFEGKLIPTNYMLGDTLTDGSIVFHIDASGQHGLAAKSSCETGRVSWAEANYLAKSQGSDWRLPTKGELEILYNRKTLLGELLRDYWSSTEYNNSSAWHMNFYNGYQHCSDKGGKALVCAIRAF
jgi:DNA polymerase-1